MKTITICGSMSSIQKIEKAKLKLEKKGFTIFIPQILKKEVSLKMKPELTEEHFRKIHASDAVLIFNSEKHGIQGYFGPSTLMELSVALFLGKELFLLNPFNETHPFYDEIAALDFIDLNGDLSQI